MKLYFVYITSENISTHRHRIKHFKDHPSTYHIRVHILSEVNSIKNAHELIFDIWYSEQISLPQGLTK